MNDITSPRRTPALSGLSSLQKREYADVKRLLKGLDARDESFTGFWQRYHGKAILGAALMAERHFTEAETLLVDGYEGLTAQSATIPAESRIALERTIRWIFTLD